MYEDLQMYAKGEYLGAGASTKFVLLCINILQCRHFVAFAASVFI